MKKEQIPIRLENYKNVSIAKFDNRRCIVEDLDNEDIGIIFKSLDLTEADIPRAICINKGDKVSVTQLRISAEGASALYMFLKSRIETREYLKNKEC